MRIDAVCKEDAPDLLEIYAPYVKNTAVSFEYEIPTIEEFENRILQISCRYPYLKLVDDDSKIVGYCYAAVFKDRRAYDWSVETTIYLKEAERHKGYGKLLYDALEKELIQMGIRNANACIALPKQEDSTLSSDSVKFHEKMGYKSVGVFHYSGYKFQRWYDMIWMEKMLGEHTELVETVRFKDN